MRCDEKAQSGSKYLPKRWMDTYGLFSKRFENKTPLNAVPFF